MARRKIKHNLYALFAIGILLISIPIFILNKGTNNGNKNIVLSFAEIAIKSIIRDASEVLLTGGGEEALINKIKEIVLLPAVVSIQITDQNGVIQIESYDDKIDHDKVKVHKRKIIEYLGDSLLDTDDPLLVGYLYVGIDDQELIKPYNEILKINLFFTILDLVCVTFLIHFIFNNRVIKPASEITKVLIDGISRPQGKKSLEHLYGDEIGDIAQKIDDCIISLYHAGLEKEKFEKELSKMELYADSVNVATYMTLDETLKSMSPILHELMTQISDVLIFSDIDSKEKRRVFSLLSHLTNSVNKLEHVTKNPLEPHFIKMRLKAFIDKTSSEMDIKVEVVPYEFLNLECNVDVTRMLFLLRSLEKIVGRLSGKLFIEPEDCRVICKFIITSDRRDRKKIDVSMLNDIFQSGKLLEYHDNFLKKQEAAHLLFLKDVMNFDITFFWSEIKGCIEVYLGIPLYIYEESSNTLDRKVAIISEEENQLLPYSQALLKMEVYTLRYRQVLRASMTRFDYIVFDSEGVSMPLIEQTVQRLRLDSNQKLFLLAPDGDLNVPKGLFDFELTKPISSSRLLNYIRSTDTTEQLLRSLSK